MMVPDVGKEMDSAVGDRGNREAERASVNNAGPKPGSESSGKITSGLASHALRAVRLETKRRKELVAPVGEALCVDGGFLPSPFWWPPIYTRMDCDRSLAEEGANFDLAPSLCATVTNARLPSAPGPIRFRDGVPSTSHNLKPLYRD